MKLKEQFGFTDIYLISEPDKDHNAAHWFTEYKYEVMEATDEDLKYFLDTVFGNMDDIWEGAPIEVAIKEFMSEVNNNIRGCEGTISINMGYKDFTLEVRKTRLQNREFNNKYIIGCPWDFGSSDVMTGDTCPECGHVLVKDEGYENDLRGHFCSDCEYADEKLKAYRKKKEEKEEARRKEPEAPFFESTDPIGKFCEQYLIENKVISCPRCNIPQAVEKYGWSFGWAQIVYHCKSDGCEHNGSRTMVPLSQKEKDKWAAALGRIK